MAASSLAALERQRGYHAEAEVEWLLTHNGVTPQVHTSVFSLRQRIGAALVHAGQRLANVPGSGVSSETTPEANTYRGTPGRYDGLECELGRSRS
jgi:hypothetical protein